ncbi:F-box only protein 21-like [Nylanderia fulva]|uniref:F-box only protein 21-like n=1 Tax=Nylanderia fulva TaxID=613905 RepID=UPI0010FB8B44|nr:F-box only protein 21-like [Nylanderia fulva]
MATIQYLPDEMISIILNYKDITIEDIINFRCTCQQFRYAAKDDTFMEKKFCQRWSSAKKYNDNLFKINKQKKSEEYEQKRKKFKKNSNFIEMSINIVTLLRKYMSAIRYKNRDYFNSIDNKISFKDIIYDRKINCVFIFTIVNEPDNFMKYLVFIDEIKNSLTQSPRRTGCDLTERYCYEKILDKIKIHSLRKEWNEFRQLPEREQVLEWGATFAAQSIQLRKNVSYPDIQASLNNIALEVQNYLKEKHPEHSIFKTSAETLSYWKNNRFNENYWNETEGTQIIDTLNEYIFDKLNFRFCNPEDTNLEYMCIDNVLKTKYGQKIILLTIYYSVARRLGLRCDVIVETMDTYKGFSREYQYFFYCYKNNTYNLRPNLPTNLLTFPMYCLLWKPK